MIFGPYPAKLVDIHDGDTLTFDLDLGFGIRLPGQNWAGKTEISCRVFGINAPELATVAGKASLAFAKTLLMPGDICQVRSHGWDKYGGRFDGEIVMPDGRDFATTMLTNGQAIPFP